MHLVYWGLKCWVIVMWLQQAHDWTIWAALPAAAVLALVPLLSWGLAIYAATIVWGWSLWFAAVVFTFLMFWAFEESG